LAAAPQARVNISSVNTAAITQFHTLLMQKSGHKIENRIQQTHRKPKATTNSFYGPYPGQSRKADVRILSSPSICLTLINFHHS